MTNAIDNSHIESYAHNNIISFVNNRSYISDPRDVTNSGTRKFVYEADPFEKDVNYEDMPYIICYMPTIEYSKTSIDGKTKTITWKHVLVVRSSKSGESTFLTKSNRNDMLNICDDIHSLFNTESRKQDFRNLNMFNLSLVKTRVDNATDMYEAEFELTYDLRLEVTS